MKIKAFVHADKNIFDGKMEYKLYPFDTSIAGSIVMCVVEMEVAVPTMSDYEERKKAALRKGFEIQLQRAEAEVLNIKKQLESL